MNYSWNRGEVIVRPRDTRRLVTQQEQTALHLKLLAAERPPLPVAKRMEFKA
jgi:hypothetical protein